MIVNKHVKTFYSREDWLNFRRAFIGASEVSAILGKSPWAGPYDIWLQKTQGESPKETIRMRAGRALERLILDLYSERTGMKVEANECYEVYYDPEHFICATPDGFVEMPGGPGLVECKTSSRLYRNAWGDDGGMDVPIYYYLQAVAQIGAIEAASGIKLSGYHFAVLFDMDEFCVFPVDVDEARKLYASMAAIIKDWYYTHIVGNVPPDRTPTDTAQTAPQRTEEMVTADPQMVEVAEEYLKLSEIIRSVQDELERCEERIKTFIGEHAGLITPFGVFSWKQTKDRVSIDYQAIVEHLNVPQEIIAKFTKVTPGVRRFIPPKVKRSTN